MPSSPLAHHFFTMACNDAWASHRLLTACAQLSQADFAAKRVSFFPSIASTLNHLVTVDWFYVDALERALASEPPNEDPFRFFEPEEPFDTCAALGDAQRAVDRRLVALARSLTDDALVTDVTILRRAGPQTDSVTRILAHLFQHQIHHRGQVHAMLAGTSVAPPPLDEFFCAADAPLRGGELSALGLTEEAIWRAL